MVDLEASYYVVRFRSKKNYDHVLLGGPWLVLGHYLTVTKWRPNFRPSKDNYLYVGLGSLFPNSHRVFLSELFDVAW